MSSPFRRDFLLDSTWTGCSQVSKARKGPVCHGSGKQTEAFSADRWAPNDTSGWEWNPSNRVPVVAANHMIIKSRIILISWLPSVSENKNLKNPANRKSYGREFIKQTLSVVWFPVGLALVALGGGWHHSHSNCQIINYLMRSWHMYLLIKLNPMPFWLLRTARHQCHWKYPADNFKINDLLSQNCLAFLTKAYPPSSIEQL